MCGSQDLTIQTLSSVMVSSSCNPCFRISSGNPIFLMEINKEKLNRKRGWKFYFVVHSPEEKLANGQGGTDKNIELILPKKLAHMVVDSDLTDWLLKKIR